MAEKLPKRIEEFQQSLASVIPCKPDNDQTRRILSEMAFSDFMFVFLNWRRRFIPQRQRSVYFSRQFWNQRALGYEKQIYGLADTIRRGADISPLLSPKIHTNGFVPRAKARRGIEWGDKDFALNAYGLHHLHLGGRKVDELVFAEISREVATFVYFGTHQDFKSGVLDESIGRARADAGVLVLPNIVGLQEKRTSEERTKLARFGLSTIADINGTFVITNDLSTAGTSTNLAFCVKRVLQTLKYWDAKLDTPKGRAELGPEIGAVINEPMWAFWFCDLCLMDRESKKAVVVLPGPL